MTALHYWRSASRESCLSTNRSYGASFSRYLSRSKLRSEAYSLSPAERAAIHCILAAGRSDVSITLRADLYWTDGSVRERCLRVSRLRSIGVYVCALHGIVKGVVGC
jgi:hypothetical protein